MSKDNFKEETAKNGASHSDEKFLFVDEGATDDIYDMDSEQVVSISDDAFYQELAQEVLENNVQAKVAKDMATAQNAQEDAPVFEVGGLFVEEDTSDAYDDVVEVSVEGSEYVRNAGAEAVLNEVENENEADGEE